MPATTSTPTLVLVVGAGRSGTSTIAGALDRLGYVVPEPVVAADESNPRGFYEPEWVVDFHQRILDTIGVRSNDARPEAVPAAAAASDDDDLQAELDAWVQPLGANSRTVVKDPRTYWFHDLWRKAAGNAGVDLAFITMLRHPAAVARSRDTHYLAGHGPERRRARETTNVAAWCHGILVSERLSRHDRRAFVPYTDLVADWRAALRRADTSLDLGIADGFTDEHHPIDEFIEPSLDRSQVSWDDLSVHPQIRDLAEEVWVNVGRLVADARDSAAIAALDELHERYDEIYTFAKDLTLDQRTLDLEQHRKRRRELRERVQGLEGQLRREQERNETLERELASARGSLPRRLAGRLRRR